MSKEIEEGLNLALDFTKLKKIAQCKEDVIPAIAQCADTGEVLIVGYVNKLALETAVKEGMATFWSTSRNELWIKGKTSGDFLEIVDILVNCEQNSIVYKVRLKGKGVPSLRNKEVRGDHYVTLVVQTPTNLNEEAKKALEAFDAACGNRPAADSTAETSEKSEKTEKKKKGFREKVKEMFEE